MNQPKSLLCAVVCALSLLGPAPAQASSYFLDQIPHVVPRVESRRLVRVGVRTTDDLAYRGATPQGREELARLTGIARARLAVLSALSDLMRLRGVGPDAARALSAAGCRTVADLQRADPQLLADEIKRINDRTRLTTNPPRADNLVAWIAQAQQLAPLFQPEEEAPYIELR